MKITSIVKLFDADSLEYAGSIEVRGFDWNYAEVKDENLIKMTSGMPVKGVLAMLINFNLVYDIISQEGPTGG